VSRFAGFYTSATIRRTTALFSSTDTMAPPLHPMCFRSHGTHAVKKRYRTERRRHFVVSQPRAVDVTTRDLRVEPSVTYYDSDCMLSTRSDLVCCARPNVLR
jgi:hypothetical protein